MQIKLLILVLFLLSRNGLWEEVAAFTPVELVGCPLIEAGLRVVIPPEALDGMGVPEEYRDRLYGQYTVSSRYVYDELVKLTGDFTTVTVILYEPVGAAGATEVTVLCLQAYQKPIHPNGYVMLNDQPWEFDKLAENSTYEDDEWIVLDLTGFRGESNNLAEVVQSYVDRVNGIMERNRAGLDVSSPFLPEEPYTLADFDYLFRAADYLEQNIGQMVYGE